LRCYPALSLMPQGTLSLQFAGGRITTNLLISSGFLS
jgi:hypothetical protein